MKFLWAYLDRTFGGWKRYRAWRGGEWESKEIFDGAFRNVVIWKRRETDDNR